MRYIDWIALAHRMRNIVRDIKVKLDVILKLGIETRTDKTKPILTEIKELSKLIIGVEIKEIITSTLGIEAYEELLINLEVIKIFTEMLSSEEHSDLVIEDNSVVCKTQLLELKDQFSASVLVELIKVLTKLLNDDIRLSELEIEINAFSGILHEVMENIEVTLDTFANTVISNVIQLSLEVNSIDENTSDIKLVMPLILETFYCKAVFTLSAQTNEVKTKRTRANANFDLELYALAKREIMRKLSDAYPILLSDVLEMSINDFYYVYI